MTNSNLDWLAEWYVSECNNDWEHSYGVKIDTLDNPGWKLEIDLSETTLEGHSFKTVHGEPAGDLDEWRELGSWWVAESDGVRFKAACGPTDLSSVIGIFKQWVESEKS